MSSAARYSVIIVCLWSIGVVLALCMLFGISLNWVTAISVIVLMTPQVSMVWLFMNVPILWKMITGSSESFFVQAKVLYGCVALMRMFGWDSRCAPVFYSYLCYAALICLDSMHHSMRRNVKMIVLLPLISSLCTISFMLLYEGEDFHLFTIGAIKYTAVQVSLESFKTTAVVSFKNAIQSWNHPERYSNIRAAMHRQGEDALC